MHHQEGIVSMTTGYVFKLKWKLCVDRGVDTRSMNYTWTPTSCTKLVDLNINITVFNEQELSPIIYISVIFDLRHHSE